METPPDEDRLSESHYVTLVLRMMLDQHGHLVNGEIVEVESKSVWRFIGWRGLIEVLRDSVIEEDGDVWI